MKRVPPITRIFMDTTLLRRYSLLVQHNRLLVVRFDGDSQVLASFELLLGDGERHHDGSFLLAAGWDLRLDLQRPSMSGQIRIGLQIAIVIAGRGGIVRVVALVSLDSGLDAFDVERLLAYILHTDLNQNHWVGHVRGLAEPGAIDAALPGWLGALRPGNDADDDCDQCQRDGNRRGRRQVARRCAELIVGGRLPRWARLCRLGMGFVSHKVLVHYRKIECCTTAWCLWSLSLIRRHRFR